MATVATSASRRSSVANGKDRCTVSIWALILSNILIFQLSWLFPTTQIASVLHQQQAPAVSEMQGPMSSSSFTGTSWNRLDPLAIPPGQAQNLPSIRVQDEELEKKRKIYGGANDGKHLGGFTELDTHGISPTVWTNMITEYGVRSFLDIGCGKGVSTRWMLEHGVDVLCVEGSHDAVMQSFLPPERVVEHDFSRGPWWPGKTYDMAWSVEFLEHVSRQYHFNYITTLRKAALIFVTSSRWGGWHHVEIHPDDWWIRKFELYGFKYDETLTTQVKQWVAEEKSNSTMVTAPNGERYFAQHLATSLKVFINPMVAALPEHAHLFPRHGCWDSYIPAEERGPDGFRSKTRPCGTGKEGDMETPLPDSFLPLKLTPEMHQRWHDAIAARISAEKKK